MFETLTAAALSGRVKLAWASLQPLTNKRRQHWLHFDDPSHGVPKHKRCR